MGKEIKIDVIAKEIIKPSSPTPPHLQHIKLSLFDQFSYAMSTPILLFYHSLKCDDNNNIHQAMEERSEHLKSSLSNTLTLFYPLAGNVVDNTFIKCNDYGIQYTTTRVSCCISDVFHQPDDHFLEKLIPIDLNSTSTGAIVQVNFFSCGGLAIGVSLSHKIADAASLVTFLMAWVAISFKTTSSPTLLPHFISDSIIPSIEDSLLLPSPPPLIHETHKCKTRRYTLDVSKVSILKAEATSTKVQQPTRVEAVTALLWKCLMAMSRLKHTSQTKLSALTQSVNLRRRFVPVLPQNYFGNLSGKFIVETPVTSNQELGYLVSLLREGLEGMPCRVTKESHAINMARMLKFAEEFKELHDRNDIDLYCFTSLCGFPLYEMDFGWGNPTWAIVTNLVLKNYVVMIDMKDSKGVEVWMSLCEEDIALFEQNEELLAFVSINPTISCGHGKKATLLESSL